METDGFLNEFSFQCHNHFLEEGGDDAMVEPPPNVDGRNGGRKQIFACQLE